MELIYQLMIESQYNTGITSNDTALTQSTDLFTIAARFLVLSLKPVHRLRRFKTPVGIALLESFSIFNSWNGQVRRE